MNDLFNNAQFESHNKEQLELIWSHIKNVSTAVITLFHNERWFSAPMSLVQDNFNDGRLYFFADQNSSIVQEIKEHKAVLGVIFSHPGEKVYVSICGAAMITSDSELIDRYWDNKLLKWLPKGEQDPALCLIVVDAHSAEYWDEDSNRLQAAFDKFITGATLEGISINEHERIHLN